ncbi:MAG: zinc ribbon domain-containing protein [Nitrospirae bacterium]|nr:zinc ribbon domain-containing protein [Nitrospirota bacterium]
MICYRCKNNIPKDAVKCPVCGVKAMPFVGAKTCPNCGTVNPVSARYCINDGYSFAKVTVGNITDDHEEEETTTAVRVKRKKHPFLKLLMWALIAIVCLVGSSIVGYQIFKPGNYLLEKHSTEALVKAGLKDITVKVDLSRTARLTGTVRDQHEKLFAEAIVKEIPKIGKIENNIVVSKLVPKPEELEKIINNSLKSQGFPGVVVSVNTAFTASIIGTVPGEYERNKVLSIVKGNKDINNIKDNLHVNPSLSQPIVVTQDTPPPHTPTPSATPTPQASAQPAPTPAPTPKPAAEPTPAPPQTATPPPPADPQSLEGTINKGLKSAGLTNVTAEVNENLDVTLKGTVSSAKDKGKAFDVAKKAKGAKKIKDKVFVVEQ